MKIWGKLSYLLPMLEISEERAELDRYEKIKM